MGSGVRSVTLMEDRWLEIENRRGSGVERRGRREGGMGVYDYYYFFNDVFRLFVILVK